MADFPKNLNIKVHFEDGSYWADVPECRGCFAAGDTIAELTEAIEEALSLYLSSADREAHVRLPAGALNPPEGTREVKTDVEIFA